MPLYMQVSQDDCVIHLSEHHGDASPGSAIRVETKNVKEYCNQLNSSGYKFCKPGEPEKMPWGLTEIDLSDPFGNRLTFYQA